MSAEHFSVDGTLIEAWASMKSFRPKDEDDDSDSNGWSDFKGQKRKNDTHESKTDPEAKLMRKGKGKEAKLSFSAHSLTENRNGLVVDFEVTEANGTCERDAALEMLDASVEGDATLGADSAYDTKDFVAQCRDRGVTPHVAQKKNSAIDGRTTRHPGYQASQKVRKRIEVAPDILSSRDISSFLEVTGLRLAQDHRWFPKDSLQGTGEDRDVRPHGSQLIQPTSNGKTGGGACLTRAPRLSADETAAGS